MCFFSSAVQLQLFRVHVRTNVRLGSKVMEIVKYCKITLARYEYMTASCKCLIRYMRTVIHPQT